MARLLLKEIPTLNQNKGQAWIQIQEKNELNFGQPGGILQCPCSQGNYDGHEKWRTSSSISTWSSFGTSSSSGREY